VNTITRLSTSTFRDSVKGLADLLADAVTDGSSLGFLAPFDQGAAASWWLAQEAAVAEGDLVVWVSRDAGGINGTVSLALNRKPNGRHRAEVVKLMVHTGARGRGAARALLATAERTAAGAGITLLILDTETGSVADRFYRAAGWTCFGVVPGYAADPAGHLRDGSFFYKRIG
jgi:GNAT superfamily N-acetyltransferase